MFDASKHLALKCQPSYFSVNFLDMDGLINQYTIWCFVGKKYPIKAFHGQNQKKAYTRLYLNKPENIIRALSDALPTGHRAMANPTLQLHFGCGRATPPVSHSHNWPSGRIQNFLVKIGQKSIILPIKTQKLILTLEWYYRSLYCCSNAMIFKKNGQFEGDVIFCHLKCDLLWIIYFRLKLVSAVYTPTQWAHQNWFESGENFKSFPCKTSI